MRKFDILAMAIHNLSQRKARTLLNLVGIVVGCIVLVLTSAAVRGVKDTVHVLFDSSEAARQIGVLSDNSPIGSPPAEAITVTAEMSEDRKERIVEQLTNTWRHENRRKETWRLNTQTLEELRALPNVSSVIPDVDIRCTASVADGPKTQDGMSGIDIASPMLERRLLSGTMLQPQATEEVLIDEYLAYRMGYQSDAELEALVGQTLRVEYRLAPDRSAQLFNVLIEKWGELSLSELAQQGQFLSVIVKLMGQLEATNLTDQEKQLLRGLMGEQIKPIPAEEQLAVREFTIRGVTRQGDDDQLTQLFRGHWQGGRGGIQLHIDLACEIFQEVNQADQYYSGIVTVDSTRHLSQINERLEAIGARTLSAVRIVNRMDESVDESAWVVFGIAAAILLTAGIGISNTLLVSVLERTPEFGILKSVGAKNSTLLWLMVCEGAILGLLGAAIATAASLLLAYFGHGFLEMYLEYRLGGEIAASLFQFSFGAILLVGVISVAICVIASIIPAWRAARLDPIVAMRRS